MTPITPPPRESVPQGTIYNFTMESTDSKFYSGVARETPPGQPPPPPGARQGEQPSRSVHPQGGGLCPETIRPGTVAPFIVGADGPDRGCSRRSII
jgi:iron(III)-enterobactin esterase